MSEISLSGLLGHALGDKPGRSACVAKSKNGREYGGISVASDTHLLALTSEQTALCNAVSNLDYGITELTTMIENPVPSQMVSPLVVKFIIDHTARTGQTISWRIEDTAGKELFACANVRTLAPYYTPQSPIQTYTATDPKPNIFTPTKILNLESLIEYARGATQRAFLASVGGNVYATAVVTKRGKVYVAAQYSSFEHRLNIHAEMAALVSAQIDGAGGEITDLVLVSTKFQDTLPGICGDCRQFISEFQTRTGNTFGLTRAAFVGSNFGTSSTDELLPEAWTNKQ